MYIWRESGYCYSSSLENYRQPLLDKVVASGYICKSRLSDSELFIRVDRLILGYRYEKEDLIVMRVSFIVAGRLSTPGYLNLF